MRNAVCESAACFKPVFNENSRVLLLGTVPSVDSVKYGFYYMNKGNYFWRLLSDVSGAPFVELADDLRNAQTAEKRKTAENELISRLFRLGVALFDTISTCERTGSTDDKILSYELNGKEKILDIIRASRIEKVFCTSGEALKNLYRVFGGKDKADGEIASVMKTSADAPTGKLLSPSRRAFQPYAERLKDWKKLLQYINGYNG